MSIDLFKQEDLKIQSWPVRPKGGQHVGVETGVRVEHLPTGIAVEVNCGRSQYINRSIALDALLFAVTHPKVNRW